MNYVGTNVDKVNLELEKCKNPGDPGIEILMTLLKIQIFLDSQVLFIQLNYLFSPSTFLHQFLGNRFYYSTHPPPLCNMVGYNY